MKPLKILCLFDYKANTGFGTVSYNIVQHLKKRMGNDLKLDICAINYFGDMYQEDENTFVFSAIKSTPTQKMPETRDDFGRIGFLTVLQNSMDDINGDNTPISERGYDGIFIIQDAPVITPIVPLLKKIKDNFKQKNLKQFKSLFYFPLDNDGMKIFTTDLDYFDVPVTYNEYSRKRILHFNPALRGKLKVIPHGLDTGRFFPIEEISRQKFREEYFRENAGKFIILNLNRNQPRKDIPCSIFAFQEYHSRNPNSFLYLHMNPRDPLGWDLRAVMMQTGLEEGVDYMFPPEKEENHDASVETVNQIYNACDVYLTTTLGEGWGLGVTEAMGCGLPVICPMHTSFFEIGANGDRVYALETLYPICGADNVIRKQCDYMEVADVLEQVQKDIETDTMKIETMTERAMQYAAELDWSIIGEKWYEMFKKTF